MNKLRKIPQIIILMILSGIAFESNGQNSVGINTSNPNPNAVLHLMSPNSNQGLLIPSITGSQRASLQFDKEDNGLLVYDQDEGAFFYWHNGKWNILNPILLDNDVSNELQNLSFDGTNLNISNGVGINISNWDLNVTDDFDGDFTKLTNVPVNLDTDATDDVALGTSPAAGDISGSYTAGFTVGNVDYANISNLPANLDTDSTDDFDGDFTSLTNVPANLDTDATDDVALDTSPAAGDISGSYTAGFTVGNVDYANISNLPANLDTDSTDDFDGDFTSLTNVPANLDTDATDDVALDTSPAAGDISGSYTAGFTVGNVDYANISNLPVNLDIDSTDDFDGDFNSLINVPINFDIDATDDVALTTNPAAGDISGSYSAGFTVGNVDYANISNLPANLDTDSTDDFDGDFTSLTNVPANLDTDATDDVALGTSPAAGDISGSYTTGFTVGNVDYANISNLPVNLDTDSTDDFDGDFTKLTNVPVNLDTDSTDDVALGTSPAAGDISGSYTAGFTVGNVDYANISNLPVNLDIDSTDDFDGDFNSLINVPINFDIDATDDVALTTNPAAGDISGSYSAGFTVGNVDYANISNLPANLDTDSTDDFDGDFTSLTNVPANLDTDATDDVALGTSPAAGDISGSYTAGFTVGNVDYTNISNLPANLDTDSTDDFDGDFTSLTNVPANLDTDATDDVALGTSPAAGDISGSYTAGFTVGNVDYANISNLPANLDTDSTDDFDGDFTSLTNVPANLDTDATDDVALGTNPAAGDISGSYTAGFTVGNVDYANISNLPANLDTDSTDDFDGDFTSLTNVPANLDTDATDDVALGTNPAAGDISGSYTAGFTVGNVDYANISNLPANLDTDSTDDFDGDFTSLTNVPANLDTDATDDVALGTSPAAGDISGSYTAGFTVGNVDYANISNLPVNLDTDATDDFDGDFTSLTNVPVNLDTDATDDVALGTSPAAGDISGSFTAGFTVGNVDYTNISNLPANLDTDSTDDFDGDFTSLTNVPANLDTDATDDVALGTSPAAGDISGSYTAGFTVGNVDYANISNLPANLDTDSTDDFDGDFTKLTNVPANLDTDATDDVALGTSPAAGDISGSYTAGFTVGNVDYANISNLPANLDTDATDDFDGDFTSLTNVPVNLDTDATDDVALGTSPAAGDISGSYTAGFTVGNVDYANISNLPANLDTDSTDDFDGDFTKLSNLPTLGNLAALNEVTTTQITDATITQSDLNSSIAGDGLNGGAGSPLSISLASNSGLQINAGDLAVLKGSATTTYGNGVGNVIHTINTDDFGRITSVESSALISDRRLKDDITKLDNSLEKALTLTGYSYYLKSDSLKQDRHYGVMAQEIEKVFPELIIQRSDGFMAVDYDGLIPVLLESIKEQSETIKILESQLSDETQKTNEYESRLSILESNLEQVLKILDKK